MPVAGLPRDPAQWLALALAFTALVMARPLVRPSRRPRLFVALAALAAAVLSTAYIAVYLRGGPRIIDATSYWLEARALAAGAFSFPLHAPEHAVLGRFLIRSEHVNAPRAAVIFPPGYPAVLALGFWAHAPLSVGPLLAAAITLATFALAGDLARSIRAPASPSVPQLAALFSVTCAALRYHTADTMSHGLAALCFAGALVLLFRAADAPTKRNAASLATCAGLAAGWLFATRPISALALAPVLVFILLRDQTARGAAARLLVGLAIGALPGILLFLAHQYAATGAWGLSSQRLYYAISDGPPGCFRYGFGDSIGCLGEHGDFVRARLTHGYGFLAAAGTTLRRLKMHLVDPANLEPLALLVPTGAFLARGSTRGRAFGLAVIAQILAYAPFYFDGNYPGGGARFFCDVLPVEHALTALAVARFAAPRSAPERWATGALALALAGFAFRAGFDHAALRDRDGGRPLFEQAELARAGVSRGLVFVDTDHGFNVAYDPAASSDIEVARFHGDDLDRMVWEAHHRPPVFRYRFSGTKTSIEPLSFVPLSLTEPLVIEGESLWPALSQRDGWALPEWASGTCASADRWLAVHVARESEPASITLELPARWLAGRLLSPRVAVSGGARGAIDLVADERLLQRWTIRAPDEPGPACIDLAAINVPAGAARLRLTLSVEESARGALALDALRAKGREGAREND